MTTTLVKKTEQTPAKTGPSAIQLMAAKCNVDPAKLYETLKQTIFPKATDQELMALIIVANKYDLDVFQRELYAFPSKGGGITPVISVDGWNTLLNRQPTFNGIQFAFEAGEDGKPYSCTATVHIKGRDYPMVITEFYSECVRKTEPWSQMPFRMLRNRALCQASRMAFGFSGIRDEEEIVDIMGAVVESSSTFVPKELPPTSVAPEPDQTPQHELQSIIISRGHTFDTFQKWAADNLQEPIADCPGFADLPTDVCRRMIRAKAGLLAGLDKIAPPK